MSLILVVLPSPQALQGTPGPELAWAERSADGRLRADGLAPVALLPGSGEVTALVPAAALSWHRVSLPQGSLGSPARLRSVLAGMLEDRLLDDPDTLHFALEPGARVGEPAWVAVCERQWLRDQLQALEGAGRRVTRIVPEFHPQPEDGPAHLYLTGDPQTAAWATLCDGAGVVTVPLHDAPQALPQRVPELLLASAEPAVAQTAEQWLGRPVPIVQAAQRWLEAEDAPWDLAQQEFATTGRARAGKKASAVARALWFAPQWRAARWGAALLVLAQLAGVNAWAWKERRAIAAKEAAVRNVLTATFPSVQLVIDAPVQMGREVAALQQATGGLSLADFEPMLGAVAGSLPAGRVPEAVDYAAGQLRLRGLGLQPAEVDGIRDALRSRGYAARAEGNLLLVQAEAQR